MVKRPDLTEYCRTYSSLRYMTTDEANDWVRHSELWNVEQVNTIIILPLPLWKEFTILLEIIIIVVIGIKGENYGIYSYC